MYIDQQSTEFYEMTIVYLRTNNATNKLWLHISFSLIPVDSSSIEEC